MFYNGQQMKHSDSTLLYEDKPEYGFIPKLITVALPAGLLAASVYLWSTGEKTGALTLLAEALLITIILSAVMPRRYRVHEDHLRIVLGRPFSVKVGFDAIKEVRLASVPLLSINFVTKVTWHHVVISKTRGMSIAITPRDSAEFVTQANRAMSTWAKQTDAEFPPAKK